MVYKRIAKQAFDDVSKYMSVHPNSRSISQTQRTSKQSVKYSVHPNNVHAYSRSIIHSVKKRIPKQSCLHITVYINVHLNSRWSETKKSCMVVCLFVLLSLVAVAWLFGCLSFAWMFECTVIRHGYPTHACTPARQHACMSTRLPV